MNRFQAAFLFFALLFGAQGAQAADMHEEAINGKPVTMWDDGRPGQKPALFFSHGFHGCSTQSSRLMNALADNGYIVFAPNHKDAVCNNGASSYLAPPDVPLRNALAWDDRVYADRGEDMRGLMAALRALPAFRDKIDWNKIGLIGHSLGGYTVLAMAGAWPSWTIPGVKAVLAYSPYCMPFLAKKTLNNLTAPVMYQGGTLDMAITPAVGGSGGCFDQSPLPRYFIDIRGANHFSWSDIAGQDQTTILVYSLAFLDHYVKGAPASVVLSRPAGDVSMLRVNGGAR